MHNLAWFTCQYKSPRGVQRSSVLEKYSVKVNVISRSRSNMLIAIESPYSKEHYVKILEKNVKE